MSDLQDLIHTNATRAYYTGKTQGALEERERIIKLLNDLLDEIVADSRHDQLGRKYVGLVNLIALIKGEQK